MRKDKKARKYIKARNIAKIIKARNKKVLETIEGPDGKLLKITSITRGKPIPVKEAIQRKIILVSKETILKFFTEQEIKTLKLNYYE